MEMKVVATITTEVAINVESITFFGQIAQMHAGTFAKIITKRNGNSGNSHECHIGNGKCNHNY